MSVKPLTALFCLVLLFPATGRTQEEKETVYRKISSDLVEDILGDLDIRFKKAASRGTFTYDFERNSYKIRLSNFGGRDLMLDAIFTPVSINRINTWNVRAKFSRGVIYPGDGKPYAALEYNLDCVGGVTPGTIKQFIRRFDSEVKAFDQFLGDAEDAAAPPVPTKLVPAAEAIYPRVNDDLLEKVFKGLNLTYTKTGPNVFTYERNNVRIRLENFGGTDLMLTAEFRKATLQEANDFNLKRNFIRAVVYKDGGREFTALERNLDVEGGVTENILRNLITSYDADVREFDRFLGKE